jgi:hypothetical protein
LLIDADYPTPGLAGLKRLDALHAARHASSNSAALR